MKLSISNIAWDMSKDSQVYGLMKKYGYSGLEIAPTRIFPEHPYEKIEEAKQWSEELKNENNFLISSMQSIWYGRQEKIFRTKEERDMLKDYTKKAIDFAAEVGCGNLVFGCPRNRNIDGEYFPQIAVDFFGELGDYALANGTVLAMEANPPIYNTNYVNDTKAALDLVKLVDSKGFLLNLDVGTMVHNQENVAELIGKVEYINHVHISEPGLKLIQKRTIHDELVKLLKEEGYEKYLSIEMGKQENITQIEAVMSYVESLKV